MDTLSLILDDIRLRGGEFRELQLYAPWAFRLQSPGLASFHIVTQGSCWLSLEGAAPLRLDTGDLVLLPGGAAHQIQDTPPPTGEPVADLSPELGQNQTEPYRLGAAGPLTRMLSGRFRFDVEMARPLVSALPPLLYQRGQGAGPPLWLRLGLQFIADERALQRPAQQAVINRLADILFIQVLRSHIGELPEGAGNWLLALRDKGLSAALSAMHRQPQKPWTVPELADLASLSRSSFADRFNQVIGQPPLAYLTEHRMRLGAWQLRHSSQPVSRIAEQVGYSSEAAFSQAFKRAHGQSPSAYRKA